MNASQSLMARTREANQLSSVLLELTYRCNLDCFFCYNDLSLHGPLMRFADYTKLLDDLAAMNVLSVSLSGGEPLAYPKFFELGAHAKSLGFVINVKTNGHSVGPRVAKRLREEVDPFAVETSLHGATSATHDRQTRVPGSFDRLMGNIRAMLDEGLRVCLNSALTAWNEHEVEAMWALADRLGVRLRFDTDITPRDDGDPEPLRIQASDSGIANLLRINMQRARTRPVRAQPIPLKQPGGTVEEPRRPKNCGAGSTHVTVDPFGNVYPCVQFRKKVGNLHEAGIERIWRESRELAGVRQLAMDAHDVKVRNDLDSFCPGLAELTTGDPLGVYPQIARKKRLLAELSPGEPVSG